MSQVLRRSADAVVGGPDPVVVAMPPIMLGRIDGGVEVVVALGANLGPVKSHFVQAIEALRGLAIKPIEVAGVYASAPWQAQGPDYLNTVCVFATTHTAPELLTQLQAIEQAAGRTRPFHHAPRTLDLDLIHYGESRIDSPHLQVPHPRWMQRGFVVEPLHELRPRWTTAEMRQAARDPSLRRLGDWAAWSES